MNWPCFFIGALASAQAFPSAQSHVQLLARGATGDPQQWHVPESSGLCGLYSLYAVASALGTERKLADFLSPRFCTDPIGSSAADLCLAAAENGLESRTVAGLSVYDIRRLNVPAIFHFRPRGELDEFVHWVAFLGVDDDGRIRILDPQHGLESLPLSEVASRFDGTAILIGLPGTDWATPLWPLRLARILLAVGGAGAVLLTVATVNWIFRRFSGNRHAWPALSVLFFATVVFAAIAYHRFRPDGLLWDGHAVVHRLAAHATQTFPEVDREVVVAAIAHPNKVALVDARYTSAYTAGSIPGAVNYPLDIDRPGEEHLLGELGRRQEVIVFCQSEGCLWSDHIARRLAAAGIREVRIYRDGYYDWIRSGGSER